MHENEEMFYQEHLSFASYFHAAGQVLKDVRYTEAYKLQFLESLYDLFLKQLKQETPKKI